MDLKNKRVLVAGTGISGIGAAGLLLKTDADIILYDGNEKLTEEGVREKLPKNSREVSVIIGALTDEVIRTLDIAVLSPGIPTDAEFVNRIREAGVIIWG